MVKGFTVLQDGGQPMVKGFTMPHWWRTINGEGVYHAAGRRTINGEGVYNASLMEDNQW